jgi:hypothetical protein
MAQVIQFSPRRTSPSGLLRAARERSGMPREEWASRLGQAVGRPQLLPGTIQTWEEGAITPPLEVVDAAQRLAQEQPLAPPHDGFPALPSLLDPRPAAATPSESTSVEDVMEAFRDADRQVGGGYVYGAVIRYLERQVAPRLFTGTSDIFAAAAALTEMAGWMAHDAGDDAIAHQHFHRASRFASTTDDVELTAHVHASRSHLAQHLENPRDALRLAQVGKAVLRRRDHHPALAARLHAMEARALAALRRRADCARALMNAEKALDRFTAQEPSPWVSPFDYASLASEACQCMQQLLQWTAAREPSEQVIGLRSSSHARSRAFGQLRLASILVSLGEIEHACSVAQAALTSSDRLSSSRVLHLLHALHRQLLPHATTPTVEPVTQSLSIALTTRAHSRLLIAAVGNPEP